MLPTIRVLCADNHQTTRDGIEVALNNTPRIEVVGSARDFTDVLCLIPVTHPDVVILDILGMDGSPLGTVRRIKREYPSVRVIMFSSTVVTAPEMLRAGATGYVAKDELTDQLVDAIYTVYAGGTFVSPLVQEYLDKSSAQVEQLHLTPREWDILKLNAHGYNTEAMAHALNIDPRSVDNYVARIRKKTGCQTRIAMANHFRMLVGEPEATQRT